MYASEDSTIEFNLVKVVDTLRYARAEYTINDITKYFNEAPKENIKNLKDVIVIITDKTYSIEYDLQKIYWSKKFGYVRYDFKNNYYWTLQKFIRNDKNILI